MAVLECKFVAKSYDAGIPVLNGLSLRLPRGRILGLLGPNGCGKSTFIKLVAGLLQPDGGSITVDGCPVGDRSKGKVSYLPERSYFSADMKVAGLVRMFSDFYSDFDPERAAKMLSDLMVPVDAKLAALSKGTREKVQLILVMARRASLYLLDEPIGGVDPAARDYVLRTLISGYDRNASMIITTHLIRDVEDFLDDFIFMGRGGQLFMGGNVRETRERYGMSLDQLFREVYRG